MARSVLYDEFLHFVKAKRLFKSGECVLAAVSGGPDSVALLHLLRRLGDRGQISLAACHLDHMLRGEESSRDARFVAEICSKYNVQLETARRDVAALAKESGAGVEEAARRARYEFFAAAAAKLSCTTVATAHTLSDNAETVLQRLIEGAGPAGLSGIPLSRPLAPDSQVAVVRPLLFASRERIESYLAKHRLPSALDHTNLAPLYLRNRIRLELVPLLKGLNPSVEAALSRTGESVGALMDFVEDALSEATAAIVDTGEGSGTSLKAAALTAAHPALAGEVVRRALLAAGVDGRRISSAHIRAVLELADAGSPSGELHLPGALVARREYDCLTIAPPAAMAGADDFCAQLRVPGEVALPGGRSRIEARPVEDFNISEFLAGKSAAEEVIDAEAVCGGLAVRFPREGERFRPLGAHGEKKLQDFFVDEKVPRRARAQTPLVVDDEGIVWVAGLRIAERVSVTAETSRFLHLRLGG